MGAFKPKHSPKGPHHNKSYRLRDTEDRISRIGNEPSACGNGIVINGAGPFRNENWDIRDDNLKKQAHLLCAKELKKRGITRYDAEIILSQGIKLPSPKVVLDRQLPGPIEKSGSVLVKNITAQKCFLKGEKRHLIRGQDGRFIITDNSPVTVIEHIRRSPRFKIKSNTTHLYSDFPVRDNKECHSSIRVNLTDIFNSEAKKNFHLQYRVADSDEEVRTDVEFPAIHTFPRKKLLQKYLASKLPADDNNSIKPLMAEENIEADILNSSVRYPFESYSVSSAHPLQHVKGRRCIYSDSTKSTRHSPRLQCRLSSKQPTIDARPFIRSEPEIHGVVFQSQNNDIDDSRRIHDQKVDELEIGFPSDRISRIHRMSCPEPQADCANHDDQQNQTNDDQYHALHVHSSGCLVSQSPLAVSSHASCNETRISVCHSPSLECKHQCVIDSESRNCIFPRVHDNEENPSAEHYEGCREQLALSIEQKDLQGSFQKFCCKEKNVLVRKPSSCHESGDNNSLIDESTLFADSINEPSRELAVHVKQEIVNMSEYNNSEHQNQAEFISKQNTLKTSPRTWSVLNSPRDHCVIKQELGSEDSETVYNVPASSYGCSPGHHDSCTAAADVYSFSEDNDSMTNQPVSVVSFTDHFLTDKPPQLASINNSNLLLKMSRSNMKYESDLENNNWSSSQSSVSIKFRKKKKSSREHTKRKHVHHTSFTSEISNNKIPRLTIKMRRDPILEKELKTQKSEGVIFKLEDKPECTTDIPCSVEQQHTVDMDSDSKDSVSFDTSHFYSTQKDKVERKIPKKLRLKFGNNSIDVLDIHIPPLNNSFYISAQFY